MRNDRFYRATRNPWLCSAVLALGLSCAAKAQAQPTAAQMASPPGPSNRPAASPNPGAPSSNPAAAPSGADSVEGVNVNGGRRPEAARPIPDDKRAEFDQEAAREAAFRSYRQSTPSLTGDDHGIGDPNDLSKDFPGLQSYIPPK